MLPVQYVCVFQMDRSRLAKEKQMREEALREKEDMERRMMALQDEVRSANEALVRTRTSCGLWDGIKGGYSYSGV